MFKSEWGEKKTNIRHPCGLRIMQGPCSDTEMDTSSSNVQWNTARGLVEVCRIYDNTPLFDHLGNTLIHHHNQQVQQPQNSLVF